MPDLQGLFNAFGPAPDDAHARTQADLAAIRDRDEHAFERLWLRNRPALEILLAGRFRKSLGPALRSRLDDEIDDLLQEAALAAWSGLPSFEYRGPGSVLAWFMTLAVRAANHRVEYWRTGKRRVDRSCPLPGDRNNSSSNATSGAPELRGPWQTPSADARAKEERWRIAEVLAMLPDREHQIVMLRFFAGAEWAEISQEIGAASGEAVKKECYRNILPAIAAALARVEPPRSASPGPEGG